MKLLSILFLLTNFISFCGQTKPKVQPAEIRIDSEYLRQALLFLEQVKHEELNNSSFLLLEKPFSFQEFGCLEPLLADTANFTASERAVIIKQTKQPQIQAWNSTLLTKIKLISSDTIKNIFSDKGKGWRYFYEHFGKGFSSFSAPIFLRNFEYCIFYWDNSCGNLCGEGQLLLFKREKGKWKQVNLYCDWVS